ncbi:unnamed protein product [Moneuplotes crassus]|uniref:Uncharacterized protein n=1 Tax=Euplotes crassus TaxID=5936 RepID=A0AAD2D1G9_EUPCR|nr:unnamed protein product [Moneuplotes crassus]
MNPNKKVRDIEETSDIDSELLYDIMSPTQNDNYLISSKYKRDSSFIKSNEGGENMSGRKDFIPPTRKQYLKPPEGFTKLSSVQEESESKSGLSNQKNFLCNKDIDNLALSMMKMCIENNEKRIFELQNENKDKNKIIQELIYKLMHCSCGCGAIQKDKVLNPSMVCITPVKSIKKSEKQNFDFRRDEQEQTIMKEKYKKMIQSNEFTDEPIDLEPDMPSVVKGSTTFRVGKDTPARVESNFCFGGGNVRIRAKALNMEKVSKLFDEIDDDLKPYDGEVDQKDLETLEPANSKASPKKLSPSSKSSSKNKRRKAKQNDFKFVNKPVLNEDASFALLGKKRKMEIDENEDNSSYEGKRSNTSKDNSEAIVNIYKIANLKDIISNCKETEITPKHPEFNYPVCNLLEQKMKATCICRIGLNILKTDKAIINCLICQGKGELEMNQSSKSHLERSQLVKVIIQCLEEYKYEDSLTEDWIVNQLQHIFRVSENLSLDYILTQIYLRHSNEMNRGKLAPLILSRCLVKDECISKCMNLWVIDIQHCNEEMTILRLSDYFYSINIIFKPKQFPDDQYFLSKIHEGRFKVGTKVKCQNIVPCDIPLENAQEYTNPVVNAQSRDTFKLCYNSCEILALDDQIGECEGALYKSIGSLKQLGGATCNLKATILDILPTFYFGMKGSYSRNTHEFIQSDIYSKIHDEIQGLEENSERNADLNLQEIEQIVKEKHKYDPARSCFGLILKNFGDQEVEDPKTMLVLISDWPEEKIYELKSGDVLDLNYLISDQYGANSYPYNLVFKMNKSSALSKIELSGESEDIKDFGIKEYYPEFKSSQASFHEENDFEYTPSKFINITGVVIKIFQCNEPRNSAKEKELRSLIIITSCLTLVSVNIHSNCFILSKFLKQGDVIYIENLCYETSNQYHKETQETVLLRNNFENEDKSKETINQFKSCNFTTINKSSKSEIISQDLKDLKDLVSEYAKDLQSGAYKEKIRSNSRRKSSKKTTRRSRVSSLKLESSQDSDKFHNLLKLCEDMLGCKIDTFEVKEVKSKKGSHRNKFL